MSESIFLVFEYLFGIQTNRVIYEVKFTDDVARQLRKVPVAIRRKLQKWVEDVAHDGLEMVRKIPGFHDEPLKGKRLGQRSIRLSRQWRAIYVVVNEQPQFVQIEEVTPHDY